MSILMSCVPFSLYGEIHTVTVTGRHAIGPYDSDSDSRQLALLQAKILAAEQALSNMEESLELQPFRLNREELITYGKTVLRYEEYPSQMSAAGTGTIRSVDVKVTIDPSHLADHLRHLLQHERAKSELTRAMDKIASYRKDIDADTVWLTSITTREDAQPVLDHRRERLKLINVEERIAATWSALADLREPVLSHDSSLRRAGDSGNAEEHRKRAASLVEAGNYDEAVMEYRVALRLMPTMIGAQLGLGVALQGKGDVDGAIAQYRLLLTRHPQEASVHMNLGTALQRQGKLDEAIAEYRTALRLRPDYALSHFNLGTALASNGSTEDAITEYRTAVRLNPDLIQAYFDLGSLLKDKDQLKEAAEAFREYVRRAPNTAPHQPWIARAESFLADRYEQRRLERREPR